MESTKYLFAEPEFVEGLGNIYPVQMRFYDEFMSIADVLTISYDHFDIEKIKESLNGNTLLLLDLIILNYRQSGQEELIVGLLKKIFSFVCKQNIEYEQKLMAFFIEGTDLAIDGSNYDEVRDIILKQNLIFSPKVYKHEATRKLAEKIIQTRAKNSLKISSESMVAVLALSGISLNELKNYSIYQIKTLFQYKLKYENYKTMMLFKTVDTSGNINPDHFAEEINMFVNPYNDLFKDKSQFSNLKNAGLSLDG